MKKNKPAQLTLPSGSRRIKNKENKRVWLIHGREYASRREYFEKLRAKAQEIEEARKAIPESTT